MEEPVSQVPWFKHADAGEQILMFVSLSVIRTSIVSKEIYKDTASPSQESAGVFECTTSTNFYLLVVRSTSLGIYYVDICSSVLPPLAKSELK